MKLFSDSRWLLKCGTGVLPLSIFQYSWRRLNIHVTNKATFGKASDWATVQTAKRLLWLPLPSWEPESWFKEKSSARSDQIWCVARIHADEHQRCFFIYIYTFQTQSHSTALYRIDFEVWPLWSGLAPDPGCNSQQKDWAWLCLLHQDFRGQCLSQLWSLHLHITENVKTNSITLNFLNISRISMPTTTAGQHQLMQENKMAPNWLTWTNPMIQFLWRAEKN